MDNTCELITKAREGCREARDRLILENAGLVWSVVRRFQGRGYEAEDLFQIGNIGLLKCIDNFDLNRQVKFSTYAVPLIMGEIRRFLRDDGMVKVSRGIKELSCHISKEKERFQTLYLREPTIKELAENLSQEESDIIMALESVQEVRSLHQTIYQGDSEEIYLEDRLESRKDEIADTERKMYLNQLLASLSEDENLLIRRRYFHNETQMTVAEKMGISQVQVSRMEKRILKKLKDIDRLE